jgi:hypothetical protein
MIFVIVSNEARQQCRLAAPRRVSRPPDIHVHQWHARACSSRRTATRVRAGGNTMNRLTILSLSAAMVFGLFWSVFLFAALDLGLSKLSDLSIIVFVKTCTTAGVSYYDCVIISLLHPSQRLTLE